MKTWIRLHDSDSRKDRTYWIQVSCISRFANHSLNGAVVYFVGDADDWITVKENPSEIVATICENE